MTGRRSLENRLDDLEDDADDEKDAVEEWRAFLRGEPSPWSEVIDDG